jgi:hypothetical protein
MQSLDVYIVMIVRHAAGQNVLTIMAGLYVLLN